MARTIPHLVCCMAMTTVVSSLQLPYNPTRIFHHPNSSFAYIFDSTSRSDGETTLLSLDITKSINSSSPQFETISEALTSNPTNTTHTYIPLMQEDGRIQVINGDCSNTQDGTEIWLFDPNSSNSVGNGSWTRATLAQAGGPNGVNYLAEGMSFSSQSNGSNPTTYLFGGMCPDPDASASTWTSNASYSDAVISLALQSGSVSQYAASTVNSANPPVAEAGFTITSLPPSVQPYTGRQQEFVLIGGHTHSAFINMSQVALYSLPQESWTFLPVKQPQSGSNKLAIRQSASTVEPRSGHTAVLSEDGSKIYVFGGWVGDVNTPAQPQFAVLSIGATYGGNGQWQWQVPTTTGSGLSSNAGLYGHGATMLSGGVMMLYGGYSISTSSNKRAGTTPSTQTLLLNTSSNTWISTYGANTATQQASSQASSSGNDNAQKIGLAVGLSVGLVILLALIAFYFWWSRRLKRRSMQGERNLMSRSSDGSFVPISQPFLEKNSIDGRGGDMAALNHYWMTSERPRSQMAEKDGSATGMFVDIPSPTRGLRKGLSQRGYQYHAAPRYDDKRYSRGSGNIHPIAELDDEDRSESHEQENDHMLSEAEMQLKEVEQILQSHRDSSKQYDAPNPLRSHPVSPEIGQPPHLLPWQANAAARYEPVKQTPRHEVVVAGPSTTGRLSPTKTDDRTSSTLSDRSQRSVASNYSITRTMSTKTGALMAAVAAAHSQAGSIHDTSSSDARTSTMSTSGGRSSPTRIAGLVRSSTNGSSVTSNARGGADADSFRTARSKLPAIPSGSDLIGSIPNLDRDDPYGRALVANSPPDPSFATAQHSMQYGGRRRQGLFGSLKRAIGAMSVDRTLSMASSRGGYEADGPASATSSPTKERRSLMGGPPRRTVSDGGALLRQKRGKLDWADNPFPPYHDDPDPGDWGEPARSSTEKREAEEDWDVEDAATKRDVQVMFTIPKSRLRVVNADMDRASLRSVSDGAVSRSDSIRALRRENSRGLLRTRNDGERLRLDPMAEEQYKDKDS